MGCCVCLCTCRVVSCVLASGCSGADANPDTFSGTRSEKFSESDFHSLYQCVCVCVCDVTPLAGPITHHVLHGQSSGQHDLAKRNRSRCKHHRKTASKMRSVYTKLRCLSIQLVIKHTCASSITHISQIPKQVKERETGI